MTTKDNFQETAEKTLEEKALRACEKIVSSCLGVRGGQLELRKEFILKNILRSFSEKERDFLAGTYSKKENSQLIGAGLFALMCAEAYMMNVEEVKEKYPAVEIPEAKEEMKKLALELMAKSLGEMKTIHGWQTDAKPVNHDLNANGHVRAGVPYNAPEGVAKKLVEAFDIGCKSPSKPEPQNPVNA